MATLEIPRPGDRASFDVANLDGSPATITLTRGEERQVPGVSGIWGTEILVHIAYAQTRPPWATTIPAYPLDSWEVQFGEGSTMGYTRPVMADPDRPRLGRPPVSGIVDGWLAVPVPAARADDVVKLVSSPEVPSRLNAAGPAVVVRQPGISPAPQPVAEDEFTDEPGETFVGPAIDATGEWGTVTIERGVDLGGYRAIARMDLDPANPASMYFQNDPKVFYLEVFIGYRPDRSPAGDFGADDWTLVTGGGSVTALGFDEVPLVTAANVHIPLGTYPGALDILTYHFGGWLVFPVDRSAPLAALALRYESPGSPQGRWEVAIRDAIPPPAAVESVTPPAPPRYVAFGDDITVSDNPRAAELFADLDTCTNPVAGYTVSYPDTWYTNTAVGNTPACSWFSPTFYEVDDPEEVPDEVTIALEYRSNIAGIAYSGEPTSADDFLIDGQPAQRSEEVGVGGGFLTPGSYRYHYLVGTDGRLPESRTEIVRGLLGLTSWLLAEDADAYELDRAVLDRIMASLEFEDR